MSKHEESCDSGTVTPTRVACSHESTNDYAGAQYALPAPVLVAPLLFRTVERNHFSVLLVDVIGGPNTG